MPESLRQRSLLSQYVFKESLHLCFCNRPPLSSDSGGGRAGLRFASTKHTTPGGTRKHCKTQAFCQWSGRNHCKTQAFLGREQHNSLQNTGIKQHDLHGAGATCKTKTMKLHGAEARRKLKTLKTIRGRGTFLLIQGRG